MFHPELKLLVMSKFPVQGDFACAVGASESRVSRAIRGRIKISPDEAERWAVVIDCDVENLAPITRSLNQGSNKEDLSDGDLINRG